jgi:alkylation response protein AidB-like acyl-CoA dehydrogenase
MNFDFDPDQHEIRSTARHLVAQRSSFAAVRRAVEDGRYDDTLWQELRELGWPGIAINEADGGAGLGLVELVILLEEAGYGVAGTPLMATACAALVIEDAGSAEQKATWLPRLASGASTAALAVAQSDGSLLAFDALTSDVIVLVDADGAGSLAEAATLAIEPLETIDPTRRYATVSGQGAPLEGDVAAGLARATVALSAEILGVAQRALDMTVDYVKDRRQFGVPVGSFQAVAHRCAEMLLAIESTRSATYYAAWAAAAEPEQLPDAAAMAAATAAEAGRDVTASAIQAHGGIGFTWEADVHWLFKRAQIDAALAASWGGRHSRLVDALRRRAALPA